MKEHEHPYWLRVKHAKENGDNIPPRPVRKGLNKEGHPYSMVEQFEKDRNK